MTVHKLPNYQTQHHNGSRFRNIWGPHPENLHKKFDPESGDIRHNPLDLGGWLIRKVSNPKKIEPVVGIAHLSRHSFESSEAQIFWLGHASSLIHFKDFNILTDPVFGERVSPVSFAGPRRLAGHAMRRSEFPHIDMIIISHNHYDHAETETLKYFARRDRCTVVCPLKTAKYMRDCGFQHIIEMDWWQFTEWKQVRVTCTPAKHFSGRTATDRNSTLWASFRIDHLVDNKSVYFAGDTAFSPHFEEIYDAFGAVDVALMPVGAYEPRWLMREIHVDPDEAVEGFKMLRGKQMIGIHWGTYDLADEPMSAPKNRIKSLSADKNQIHMLDIGGAIKF